MTIVKTDADLRYLFGPVRDQGQRPTCLAFATSDAHAALRPGWAALSCEYLFYFAQRRANRSHIQGAVLSAMLEALRQDGQPEEAAWGYLHQIKKPEKEWNPPINPGQLFRRDGDRCTEIIDDILSRLDHGVPVILLLMLSPAWYAANTQTVLTFAPVAPPDPNRRHAVIACAHGLDEDGERAILIRNSWGSAWGDGGYVWVSEALLSASLMTFAELKEEIDVSASTIAA